MSFAAVVTIIGVVLTVLALAGYLIYVALVLRGVEKRLGAIAGGVEVINGKAAPAGPVVKEINQALTGVNNALQAVLTKKRPPKQAAPPPPPRASGSVLGSGRSPQVVTQRGDPYRR